MIDSQQSHFLTANGIRIHYLRGGAGSPMVLLHGWPEFCRAWWKCFPGLSAHYDVVAPDLRGFGDTE
ncbi:MAG: alpha/beta hydrolase, partial [Verrucomicrobia bacterium]|nr:alpha/beta hydrolase [Verrucomicrobiota bacterium]